MNNITVMREVVLKLFDILPDDRKIEALRAMVKLTDTIFGDIGINLSFAQPTSSAPITVVPPNTKTVKRRKRSPIHQKQVKVNGRVFPTIKKACEFYGVNYQTTAKKLKDGIPPEDLFRESDVRYVEQQR